MASSVSCSHPRTAIIAGPIVTNIGWKWLFHILVIFEAAQFILMFFFSPETTYRREEAYNIDQTVVQDLEKLAAKEHERLVQISEPNNAEFRVPAKTPYLATLKPWSGIHSKDNLFKLITAPFFTVFNIGALYTIFASGILVSWYVAVSYILAQEFSPPPYLFTAAQVGYLSTGPFVGGLLASMFMAMITDPLIRYCSKRNNGI